MSHIKIITLIEDHVYGNGLLAEHGLSVYIDTETSKILVDTGQTGAFIHNAEKLGIDLSLVDAVILSHGHHDHAGGLYPFLKINSKATVFCKRDVFLKKYNAKEVFNGTPYDATLLDNRIRYVDSPMEIVPGIHLMPETPITFADDTSISKLKVDKGNGIEIDDFSDELFVAITHNNELSIISSCSHRGITNIMEQAQKTFNLPVNLVLGGFHIKDCKEGQYNSIVRYLNQHPPKMTGICHCTGIDKYTSLHSDCSYGLFYNFTGNEIII